MLLAVTFVLATCAPQDLVIEGAKVHMTGNGKPWSTQLCVANGRILQRGSKVPEGARRIDLKGAHVYPGLHDAHAHITGLGTKMTQLDLTGLKSYGELIEMVRKRAEGLPKGRWILGRGWDQNRWKEARFPHHGALSKAVPNHPVYLTRVDGHAALVNAEAMRVARLSKDTDSPSGGEILYDQDGAPTGVLIDRAAGLVGGRIPASEWASVRKALLDAQRACLAAGLTCVHDAGMSPSTVRIVRELHGQGLWQLRVYVMLPASAVAAIRKGPWQTPDLRIIVRAVKGYADGALGSRGAALLEPYSDRPGHRGLMLTPRKGLLKTAQLCADHGFQFCVHAIGDKANREVLAAFAGAKFDPKRGPGSLQAARFRIEHAQVVSPDDFDTFLRLGVIPSMQPTHLTSDMPWAPKRLGTERVPGAYAWRSFLKRGLPVAFGSDFPVEGHDPRLGLFAAVTTRPRVGAEPLRPDQKLSRREAVTGFTQHAAHAAFLERQLGDIRAGKLADFTVFDRDILTCPEAEILKARVLMTVIGGRVVYRSGE